MQQRVYSSGKMTSLCHIWIMQWDNSIGYSLDAEHALISLKEIGMNPGVTIPKSDRVYLGS